MRMQSRYPYEPSKNELAALQATKVSWLFDELSDNNASDDGLFVSSSVAVNKQISEVISMPGNNAILVVYQVNARYNTYARDGAFRRIN